MDDAPLKESSTWKNLGKLWHADPDSAEIVRVTVNKGFDSISKLAKIAAQFWETIALPHILYGCELWHLKDD